MLVYHDGLAVSVIATKLDGDRLVRYEVWEDEEVKGELVYDEALSGDRDKMVQDILQANGFTYEPDFEKDYVYGQVAKRRASYMDVDVGKEYEDNRGRRLKLVKKEGGPFYLAEVNGVL